jgi:hypothetical protein
MRHLWLHHRELFDNKLSREAREAVFERAAAAAKGKVVGSISFDEFEALLKADGGASAWSLEGAAPLGAGSVIKDTGGGATLGESLSSDDLDGGGGDGTWGLGAASAGAGDGEWAAVARVAQQLRAERSGGAPGAAAAAPGGLDAAEAAVARLLSALPPRERSAVEVLVLNARRAAPAAGGARAATAATAAAAGRRPRRNAKDGYTLACMGEELGMSLEYVRRTRNGALEKLAALARATLAEGGAAAEQLAAAAGGGGGDDDVARFLSLPDSLQAWPAAAAPRGAPAASAGGGEAAGADSSADGGSPAAPAPAAPKRRGRPPKGEAVAATASAEAAEAPAEQQPRRSKPRRGGGGGSSSSSSTPGATAAAAAARPPGFEPGPVVVNPAARWLPEGPPQRASVS